MSPKKKASDFFSWIQPDGIAWGTWSGEALAVLECSATPKRCQDAFVMRKGYCRGIIPVCVAYNDAGEVALKSSVFHVSDVHSRQIVDGRGLRNTDIIDHVIHPPDIIVKASGKAIAEQAEIKADIEFFLDLPFNVSILVVSHTECSDPIFAGEPPSVRAIHPECHFGTKSFIAGFAVTAPDFKVAKNATITQEAFFGCTPAKGYSGERTPPVFFCELRRALAPD